MVSVLAVKSISDQVARVISLVRQAVNNRTIAAFLAIVSRSVSKSFASAFTSSVARLCVAGGSFAARVNVRQR